MKFVIDVFSDSRVVLFKNSPSFLDGSFRFVMYKITSSENSDFILSAIILSLLKSILL